MADVASVAAEAYGYLSAGIGAGLVTIGAGLGIGTVGWNGDGGYSTPAGGGRRYPYLYAHYGGLYRGCGPVRPGDLFSSGNTGGMKLQ